MAQVNPLTREVLIKLVYYGPGLGGKTTSLQWLHGAAPKETRGTLVSLATPVDRTLYFDFLPLRVTSVRGHPLRLQLFTVPGQVHFDQTRKLVLTGVDGVVFVADSQRYRQDANLESFENLELNLREQGRSLAAMPHVLQYNKRDLPNLLPREELDHTVNPYRAPAFETCATTGINIMEALDALVSLVLDDLEKRQVFGAPKVQTSAVPIRTDAEDPFGAEVRRVSEVDIETVANPTPVPAPEVVGVAAGAAHDRSAAAAGQGAGRSATVSAKPPAPAAKAPPSPRPPPPSADGARASTEPEAVGQWSSATAWEVPGPVGVKAAPSVAPAPNAPLSGSVAPVASAPATTSVAPAAASVAPAASGPTAPSVAPVAVSAAPAASAPAAVSVAPAASAQAVPPGPSTESRSVAPRAASIAPASTPSVLPFLTARDAAATTSTGDTSSPDVEELEPAAPPAKPVVAIGSPETEILSGGYPGLIGDDTDRTALSFAALFDQDAALARQVERHVAEGALVEALDVLDMLVFRLLARIGGHVVAGDAARDPTTVVLCLGAPADRWFGFRRLVRRAREGEPLEQRELLAAYVFALDLAVRRTRLEV